MPRRLFALLPLLLLLALLAPAARAEDGGEGGNDLEAQIKAKFERILKLMRENEDALLRLSAGKDGQPRSVDVEVPPPSEGAAGSGSGEKGAGGEKGAAGEKGGSGASGAKEAGEGAEAIRREMKRLLEGMTQGAGTIPDEIKELVQMIPT